MIQSLVKWSGSKRSQAKEIVSYFPKGIETYYEPFCGSCAVMLEYCGEKWPQFAVGGDINSSLINLYSISYNFCVFNPIIVEPLMKGYRERWNEFNKTGNFDDRKAYYNKVREDYNLHRNPIDFFFLNRTCYNGLIRYNDKGCFNSPCHFSRPGIHPDKMDKIILEWYEFLYHHNISFICCDFTEHTVGNNDFVYLDPPYHNTKGMYGEEFDSKRLFDYLRAFNSMGVRWALSYDGISGDDDHTYSVPQDLYERHIYIKSGNSSFKRLKGNSDAMVYESLYLNY